MAVRGETDILPTILFPMGIYSNAFGTATGEACDWQSDQSLNIRFPLGKGFSVPVSARRLLMLSGATHPYRLLPAAGKLLSDGGEAALFSKKIPEDIPPEIELLSNEELVEAVQWADYIIGDTKVSEISEWLKLLAPEKIMSRRRTIQVLVDTPMACVGTAECGVCAVKTRHGWLHACSDGPVFSLEDLEF